MAYILNNKCAKNLCKRTVLVLLIVENVVTCFLRHNVEAIYDVITSTASSPSTRTTTIFKLDILPRDAMQVRPMSLYDVRLSVCVSVMFVHSVKMNKHIFQKIFTVG